jgi:MFS family permease
VAFRRCKVPVVSDPAPDEPVADEPDYTLALEEARRGFDSLEKHLADIRNRSQQIVGIGAVAASIVGGLAALGSHKLGGWGFGALGAFAAIAVICLSIWWPRKLRVFQNPKTLVAWAEIPGKTRQRMVRSLAIHLADQYKENSDKIRGMLKWFRAAMILLAVEIVCLAVGLWLS